MTRRVLFLVFALLAITGAGTYAVARPGPSPLAKVKVYQHADQELPDGDIPGSFVTLHWDSTAYDPDGMHHGDRLVCRDTGLYQVDVQVIGWVDQPLDAHPWKNQIVLWLGRASVPSDPPYSRPVAIGTWQPFSNGGADANLIGNVSALVHCRAGQFYTVSARLSLPGDGEHFHISHGNANYSQFPSFTMVER